MDQFIQIVKKPIRINYAKNCWLEKGSIPNSLHLYKEQYQKLWNSHPTEKHTVFIFNKYHKIPRWQQAYGQNYRFSGNVAKAKPFTPQLQDFIDWANNNELNNGRIGGMNGILVNWYQNGSHYIGWHSDDESQLDPLTPIYTISLGAKRTFKIREKKNKKNVINFELENNDFLIMGGDFQKHFQHHLPKRKKCADSRVSITIRKFITG
jgi:alkylated DNA repair dioxygenase AlkB